MRRNICMHSHSLIKSRYNVYINIYIETSMAAYNAPISVKKDRISMFHIFLLISWTLEKVNGIFHIEIHRFVFFFFFFFFAQTLTGYITLFNTWTKKSRYNKWLPSLAAVIVTWQTKKNNTFSLCNANAKVTNQTQAHSFIAMTRNKREHAIVFMSRMQFCDQIIIT